MGSEAPERSGGSSGMFSFIIEKYIPIITCETKNHLKTNTALQEVRRSVSQVWD